MFKNIYNWLIKFLELQLFVTIGSLPIFVWWGLPISVMTLVGNLIFFPILSIFLLLSALIFFTQILSIPNAALILGLDSITKVWIKILSLSNKTWLIGLRDNYILFSLIPFFLAFFIVKSQLKREHKVISLAIILLLTTTFLHSFPNNNLAIKEVTQGRSKAIIQIKDHKTEVVDTGTFSKKSSKSFIKYKLLPEIIKLSGKNQIDKLIIKKLSKTSLESIKFANSIITIKEIKIVKADSDLKNAIKDFCATNSIQFTCI